MEQQKDIIQAFIKLGCKCNNNGYHLYDIAKYLREEKQLHITIYSQSQESWQYRVTRPHQKIVDGLFGEDFEDYEEALEDAIWAVYYLVNN